jgi:hypothetical protein
MKTVKIILAVLASIVILVIAGMAWMGFFASVIVTEKEMGGYQLAGLEITGEYSKVGCTMMKADSELKAMKIICTKGFGVYYDNPQVTPKEKCRSFVGDVLEKADSAQIALIKSKGLRVDSVSIKQSVVVELPIKNDMSYMIGAMKAYPALGKYISERKYSVTLSMELYDMPAKKAYYIMQFDK